MLPLEDAPCSDTTSYPVSHPRDTLACHHTSLPPPFHPHLCISQPSLFLDINSWSWTRYWASSREPIRIERPSTFTQTTPLTPTNTQPPHPLAKYTNEPWLYPPPPLTIKRRLCVHDTTQVGVLLVSSLDSLFKQSRLHCLHLCLTVATRRVYMYNTQVRHHTCLAQTV